jgi:acyl-CoA synthetase (NDP forming)
MFDVAALLANQPIPESGRIDIVTNAGGPGILAADACEANGLTVAALTSATTRTRLAVGNIPTYLFPESAAVALAHVTNTRNGGDSRWRPHHISQNSNTIPCVRSKLLLRGYRGPPAADEAAFRNLLLAVSQLLDACPEIEEMDLNPVMVRRKGAEVVDARIKIGVPPEAHRSRRVSY